MVHEDERATQQSKTELDVLRNAEYKGDEGAPCVGSLWGRSPRPSPVLTAGRRTCRHHGGVGSAAKLANPHCRQGRQRLSENPGRGSKHPQRPASQTPTHPPHPPAYSEVCAAILPSDPSHIAQEHWPPRRSRPSALRLEGSSPARRRDLAGRTTATTLVRKRPSMEGGQSCSTGWGGIQGGCVHLIRICRMRSTCVTRPSRQHGY